MTTILNHAIEYRKQGISIIPMTSYLKDNKLEKKPLIKWEQYQKTLPTMQEILGWWTQWPTAMIGIVTGELSGIMVVDADTKEACELIEKTLPETWDSTVIAGSPRGGKHYYFKSLNGKWQTKAGVLPGIDIRANGGLICAAPSRNVEGKEYRWLTEIEFKKELLEEMPDALSELLSSAQQKPKFAVDMKDVGSIFTEGRRDADLFHLALAMRKAGESKEYALGVLKKITEHWTDTNDDKLLLEKVRSAFTYEEKKERNLVEEVRAWVVHCTGNFNTADIHRELNLLSKEEKNSANKELSMLCKKGTIERVGEKRGSYRLVDNDLEEMKWYEVKDASPYEILLPFNIHNYVKIHKKGIIVVAGTSNSGKTAFMLNTIIDNVDTHKIRYFSSELSPEELSERIGEFGLSKNDWNYETNLKCYSRGSNFHDVIDPDGLNIIDFLECYKDFFAIGESITQIHNRLKSGVAIIALQKNPGRDEGLGGMRSIEKARLALAIDPGVIKIVKGKSWADRNVNPNGMHLNFKLYAGCKIIPQTGWMHP